MHSISLTQLMAEYEEQRRVILNCRKRYQIAYARYVQVMEAVVKLDSRDVQNGFAKLRE